MADVVAVQQPLGPPRPGVAQHLILLPSIASYNISLNLTSILSYLPSSSFLTRSSLFQSIRRKWWEDLTDIGGAVPLTASGTVEGRGLVMDTAAWPSESMLESVVNQHPATIGASAGTTSPPPPPPGYPGPWGFFTSGYMLGLFLVAVFLHRIQNIIVPSRLPHSRRRRFSRRMQRLPGVTALWDSVFPLDLSNTTTRLIIHLPSLYSLGKVLLIWFVLALQTSELYPVDTKVEWITRLGRWVEWHDMKDICWKTFVAVCSGFAVEGFVKALDGVEAGFPIGSNMNPNTSPFNIVGYAFLLHMYASPFAHTTAHKQVIVQMTPEGVEIGRESVTMPSRPDKHAVITVAIPLLQLTMFHALAISKKLSTHRLLPTTLSSILSLIHFHGTLLSLLYGSDWYAFWRTTTAAPASQAAKEMARVKYLTAYPILNYIPNAFETMLIGTILLTIGLNILVQLVVRGRVERVFSGLGIRRATPVHDWDQPQNDAVDQPEEDVTGFWGFLRSLPYDEDFGVLLLRIGTASLEATGLRGWSNEVAPVPAPVRRRRKSRKAVVGAQADEGREYGSVRVGRVGAGGVRAGYGSPVQIQTSQGRTSDGGELRRRRNAGQVRIHGLHNEVRTVDLGVNERRSGDRTSRGNLWWRYTVETIRFLGASFAVAMGLFRMAWAWIMYTIRGQGRSKALARAPRNRGGASGQGRDRHEVVDEAEGEAEEESEGDVYARFLRGENISDDDGEDAEFVQDEEGDAEWREGTVGPEDEGDANGSDDEDEEKEAFGLFTDLLRNGFPDGSSPGGGANRDLVLAHLIDESPMTRRRWNSLTSPQKRGDGPLNRRTPSRWDSDNDSDPFALERAPSTSSTASTASLEKANEIAARSVCVVCMSEARDVICWPCRCLAMCDGCREASAARSAPTKHRCPCCRAIVEGYSRIYVP